ncbi:MAG: FecR domain-containing protein [Treponema sp.]|nr:FecR domain-containing protein [Candidatus Treponema merdequi]
MQKKTKLQLADILFVLVCLAGAAISIYRFEKVYFQALVKHDTPIATITFKYKTAQRQFWDEVLWDRLKQNSPVYEGDLVRTAPQSSATVFFSDGNIMELKENTLVRLNLKKDGSKEVDFMEGNISMDSAESGFSIKAGNSVVTLDKGSSLDVGRGKNKAFSIQVQNGSATYFDGEGNIQIDNGNGIAVDESGTVKQGTLMVNSPSIHERYLNQSGELFPVDFKWSASVSDAVIELSDTKNFKEITESYHIKGAFNTTLMLDEGTHYWRLSTSATDESLAEVALGKIEVFNTQAPSLIAPVQDYEATYRTKTPSIRFIWKESDYATSYQIEISKSEDMINPVFVKRIANNSFFVSNLTAGRYYWRVTPYYVINNTGLKGPSEVSSFLIKQSGELEAPALLLPAENGIVNTRMPLKNGTRAYCKVNFSWKDCPEATSYQILLSRNQNVTNPQFSANTFDNYFIINTENINIENGKWYWKVVAKDVEGNVSSSEIRDFVAIDADIEQRTLFPVDGYRLSDSRSQDIRYVFKSNIPGEKIFEISRDAQFTNVIYSQKTVNNSVNGRYLIPNTYYWRIRAELGGLTFATPAKTIVIEPPMAAPVSAAPYDRGVALVRPRVPYEFKWNLVDGADYYQIKIYQYGNKDKVLYERNLIEADSPFTASIKVDLENFAETSYGLSLQAFREETPVTSRASSYVGDYTFNLVKIKPIALISPQNSVNIDGIAAIKHPSVVKWNYVGTTSKSELLIYKGKIEPASLVHRIENPEKTVQLPRLYEGKYFWTVTGMTDDGYDVSADEYRVFTIGAIPKLPEPQIVMPKNKMNFNKEYFITQRKIDFEWHSVSGADRYVFKLYDKSRKVVYEKVFEKNVTKFTIDDFSKMSVGNFTWTLEAQSMYEGYLFQNGNIVKQTFKIDLPNIKTPKTFDAGVRYGK